MTPSDFLSAAWHFPGSPVIDRRRFPPPTVTGPRRISPVPRTAFCPFRAHYAGGFLGTRFRFSGAFPGLRRLNNGSTPSCPALRQVLADDACSGLATSHSLRTGQLFRPASHPASRPRTGASLPGIRTSPRARPSLAGCLSSRFSRHVIWITPSATTPKPLGTRLITSSVTLRLARTPGMRRFSFTTARGTGEMPWAR